MYEIATSCAGSIETLFILDMIQIGEEKNEFEQMLFGKRDQDMTDKLIKLLEKDGKATYFIVVGAGHLSVKDTVIDQLTAKSYVVETVW